jgi:hypothetical protein
MLPLFQLSINNSHNSSPTSSHILRSQIISHIHHHSIISLRRRSSSSSHSHHYSHSSPPAMPPVNMFHCLWVSTHMLRLFLLISLEPTLGLFTQTLFLPSLIWLRMRY